MFELHDGPEDVRQACVAIEAEQHRERAPDSNFGCKQRIIDVGPGLGQWSCLFEQFLLEGVEGERLPFGRAPRHREELVCRDAVGPGGERALSIESIEPRDELNERFLRGILCMIWAAEETERQTAHHRLHRSHHSLESGPIAAHRGRYIGCELVLRGGA